MSQKVKMIRAKNQNSRSKIPEVLMKDKVDINYLSKKQKKDINK